MPKRTPAQIAQAEPRLVRQERGLDKGTVQELLAAGVQKFEDAKRKENSGPTRLEAAYDAMLFCALAIFGARGYRVVAEKGHHTVAFEGMAAELQLAQAHIDQIEAVQEIRHTKYTGLLKVSDADMKIALAQAQRVLNETEAWFQANRPGLLKMDKRQG
jgi:hypothetical protein